MTGIERLRRVAEAQDMRNVWTAMLSHELSDIADQIEREHNVSDREEHDAAVWVRDHGGLERVKWLLDWCLSHDSKIEQLDFDFWLSGRVMYELGFGEDMADREEVERRLLARLMPEGMEWLIEAWPKFEDDSPVKLGDMALIDGDADMVEAVQIWIHGKPVIYGDNGSQQLEKDERVKLHVPAADGVPIRVGDTVWEVGTVLAIHMTVVEVSRDTIRCEYAWTDGKVYRPCCSPDTLTHTKPEIDTWERIEEDKGLNPFDYCKKVGHKLWTFDNAEEFKASDLVRRCRALAERERGE